MTANYQHIGFRTARARGVRIFPQQAGSAPPRVYMQIGNAVAAYALDTFFTSRLAAGTVSIGVVGKETGSQVGGFGRTPLERIAMWDGFMYPEAVASQWYAPLIDKQDPMGKGGAFDADDRGNLYSIHMFGWGIAKDDGRTNGSHFPKVVQLTSCYTGTKPTGTACDVPAAYPFTKHDGSNVSGQSILAFREGSRYYAVVAGGSKDQALFDVTDASSPQLSATRTGFDKSMLRYDRSDAFSRIAYVDSKKVLHVYSYGGMVNGTEIGSYSGRDGGFVDVAIDESGNIWAAESSRVLRLTPAGNGYTESDSSPFGAGFRTIEAIAAGGGHIAAMGTDFNDGVHYDVRLAKVEASGPRLVDTDNFFKNYYHSGKTGYAEPGQYTNPFDVQLAKWNGKTYLFYSAEGLGDVFEIQGGDAISATMRTASFGTVNPNSKATVAGPYPGDIVTFAATSSNPASSYTVSWDFGNSESGTNNFKTQTTGIDVTHQYTGFDTSGKVTTPKQVRAVAVQDSAMSSQFNVVLKLPTTRVGISGTTTPITASSVVPLDIVEGATFNDASDGSVEGHYGVWVIDGTPTKLKPNETIPVGGVGAHTLQFQAYYGKYDASFVGTSPYAASAITIPYVVRPFRVRLNVPTTVGSSIRFSATPEWTSDRSTLQATQWNVSWTLTGGVAAGGVSTQSVPGLSGTYAVGVIPQYDVLKTDVPSGSTIMLEVSVDPGSLSTAAAPYASTSTSSLLTTPDPLIEQAGCANTGSPCSFTAKSVGGGSISDWALLWTVKQGNTTVATSAANPYAPTLAQGSYTVYLKATKTVFEKEVTKALTVQQSLCGPLPADSAVTFNIIGCGSGCPVGTTVSFTPSISGYSKQACDTFSWNFGDGTQASGEEVSHAYSSAGTKTVTFTISNTGGGAAVSKSRSVNITGGGNTNTCTAPSQIAMSFSGCTATNDCRTTDSIRFTVTKAGGSLQTCDTVAWSFGDNKTSTNSSPTHTFDATGTFTVTAVVSNSQGLSASATKQITIGTGSSGGNCAIAPGPANFVITFSGPTSGCVYAGANCTVNEAIAFEALNYFYVPASCDSYAWNFGDNNTSTVRNPLHSYTNNGTYSVQLTVTNNRGSFTYTRSVVVSGGAPAKPVPTISGSFPTTAQKGKPVSFTASSSMSTTTGWTWTFGDGTPADTSQAGTVAQTSTMSHTFNTAGTYTVTAKARNSEDVASAPTNSTQSQITITNAPAIPEYIYLLPVAVHAAGQGNSSWRTDVQIYNPDPAVSVDKPLEMTAAFKGQTFNLVVTKATHIYEDFLSKILDHDDQGPVIITTKTALVAPQIWTRTYNQTEQGGTFGQFIPAIRLDSAGSGSAFGEGKYYLSGLRHDDRFRTNVGFVNPNAVAINATVTVRDDRFLAIAQFTRTLQPFQLDQFTLKNLVPTLPTARPFSLQIEVPPGQWVIAYASFIDSISNDPVFLQAVRESEVASIDHRVSVIPGVGHVGQWRSDVTIFNPDIENPVQFDLEYFDNGGNKLAGATGIVLDSRKFLQYSDILAQGVLGSNVPEGLGMLKISATTPVPNSRYPMTFARTYFDDGANGTFGQGIVGFSGGKPNVKVNKPGIIAGVRQNASYQTNIGLVNVSSTATVHATITLLDPFTGAAASSLQYTLAPNQTIVGAYNGWGAIESGTLKVEADGDVWAFVSIKDKKTNDPEYVPATATQ
ncbi:MAG: PKD domain-containing protein [Acidobacteriota bacterium]